MGYAQVTRARSSYVLYSIARPGYPGYAFLNFAYVCKMACFAGRPAKQATGSESGLQNRGLA